jgi:hypothetical protein
MCHTSHFNTRADRAARPRPRRTRLPVPAGRQVWRREH